MWQIALRQIATHPLKNQTFNYKTFFQKLQNVFLQSTKRRKLTLTFFIQYFLHYSSQLYLMSRSALDETEYIGNIIWSGSYLETKTHLLKKVKKKLFCLLINYHKTHLPLTWSLLSANCILRTFTYSAANLQKYFFFAKKTKIYFLKMPPILLFNIKSFNRTNTGSSDHFWFLSILTFSGLQLDLLFVRK